MDIHHATILRDQPPARIYTALTQPEQLEIWMSAPVLGLSEVGTMLEFQYNGGIRSLKVEITRLDPDLLVQWQVIEPIWGVGGGLQIITWTLMPYESSTLIDFRMEGWAQDDDVYASVSYKWASFMMRLRLYLGDKRDIASF